MDPILLCCLNLLKQNSKFKSGGTRSSRTKVGSLGPFAPGSATPACGAETNSAKSSQIYLDEQLENNQPTRLQTGADLSYNIDVVTIMRHAIPLNL